MLTFEKQCTQGKKNNCRYRSVLLTLYLASESGEFIKTKITRPYSKSFRLSRAG